MGQLALALADTKRLWDGSPLLRVTAAGGEWIWLCHLFMHALLIACVCRVSAACIGVCVVVYLVRRMRVSLISDKPPWRCVCITCADNLAD
jgi:hypothetical protein